MDPPTEDEMKQSLYFKMNWLNENGDVNWRVLIGFTSVHVRWMEEINDRRNEIIHDACLNKFSITKKDIDSLNSLCEVMIKAREGQEKFLKEKSLRFQSKQSAIPYRRKYLITLNFPNSLPDLIPKK